MHHKDIIDHKNHHHFDEVRINIRQNPEDVVQGFNYWMDGFWKVIAGCFRQRDHVKVQEYTFTQVGCNCIIPEVECPVQKTWFTLQQPTNHNKWNRGNVSWINGVLVIQVNVEEAPCKIKWFNIY